jgi:hypothetical protein
MSVTPFKVPGMTPTQVRVEAIVKAAADAGMGGFALAILRTIAVLWRKRHKRGRRSALTCREGGDVR